MYILLKFMHISNKVLIDIFLINCIANDIDNEKIRHAYHLVVSTAVNVNAPWINTSKLCSIITTQLVLNIREPRFNRLIINHYFRHYCYY